MKKTKKTIIHVNQHVIKANKKNGVENPVLTIKSDKKNNYANEAEIVDPETNEILAKIIYSPEKPLSCGARVWIETYKTVKITKKN